MDELRFGSSGNQEVLMTGAGIGVRGYSMFVNSVCVSSLAKVKVPARLLSTQPLLSTETGYHSKCHV